MKLFKIKIGDAVKKDYEFKLQNVSDEIKKKDRLRIMNENEKSLMQALSDDDFTFEMIYNNKCGPEFENFKPLDELI